MAFKFQTEFDSPNFTPAAQSSATFGRARTIEAIAIHWWGDPTIGPTFDGTIRTLCNPNSGVSAHFVATGTGRRVAQLVNLGDVSWATNAANPYTISIECDPRCREEDYDVVAELIANIRSAYGDLRLVPHRQFNATQCPGNYNLDELNRRANLKDGSGDWGVVTDKDNDMIPDQDNYYWRYGQKTALAIRGRELSREEFKKYLVGQNSTRVLEILEDDPEADTAQNWQVVGKQAVGENWKTQVDSIPQKDKTIGELTDTVAKLKAELASKPTESTSKPSNGESGTTKPSDGKTPENGSDGLGSLFTRFIESVKKFWKS